MSDDEKSDGNGKIPTASNAASECHPAGMGASDSVPPLANRPATGSDKELEGAVLRLPIANATATVTPPADKWHVTNETVALDGRANCESCGRGFIAFRPWARFCSNACRQRAFQARRATRATA
ncbi:MAG: hypothetical protein L0332_24255 [Chloroflexi bacterium]|nr:hypothetical protein [Chloroflexota bacterium]MCI0648593.1 hypothetical protein [Chloroflexota bacterium]MCI0729808.1 hypothetical protein [Chloroflexota bacterium]